MKTDVNVPQNSTVISQKSLKKNLIFCWRLVSHRRKKQDRDLNPNPGPDPYLDPQVSSPDPYLLPKCHGSITLLKNNHQEAHLVATLKKIFFLF